MDIEKLVDSVKFLLKSVRLLSDRLVDSNENSTRSFERVKQSFDELHERIKVLETDLQNVRDRQLVLTDGDRRIPELPVRSDQRELIIPVLNLPTDSLLNVYRNTPALLAPFARACSVSGRTLSGAISEVELEVFAQGTTWIFETLDGDWVLLPRPGMLQRRTHLESLGRMFELKNESPFPAELELLDPGTASVVEHGRRWYLKDKGVIGVHSDPLQRSVEVRIRLLEQKLFEDK